MSIVVLVKTAKRKSINKVLLRSMCAAMPQENLHPCK